MKRWGLAAAFLLLTGCASAPDRAPSLGEAYAGPATLQVREALLAGAEMTATLEHGDRVEIIGRRRRFVKVRTSEGAEGWVDSAQLLGTGEMETLRALAARAAAESSQGAATVFDLLNVHTAPNRQAPSFFQMKPGMHAAVIAHQRAPRVPFGPPTFLTEIFRPAPPPTPRKPKKPKTKPANESPPPGLAPTVPDDWLSISGRPDGPPATAKPPAPETVAPPLEWWTLVRAEDGRTGWVLTSLLYLDIPEEVAQYAERARITSYYPLGQVAARSGAQKTIWLWTTLATRNVDHHYDNLRVFTWSIRRQRYETAYIERNIRGWLPVTLLRGEGGVTGWEALMENRAGQLERVTYQWDGNRARITQRQPGELPPPWYVKAEHAADDEDSEVPETSGGRFAELLRSLRERFSR